MPQGDSLFIGFNESGNCCQGKSVRYGILPAGFGRIEIAPAHHPVRSCLAWQAGRPSETESGAAGGEVGLV